MLDGLIGITKELGPELDGPEGSTPAARSAFLLALTADESSWGDRWCASNFETAYARGGHYWNTSPVQKSLVQRFESLAACSWGPTQILPVVAWEVGWRPNDGPWELADPRTCLTWTVARFNEKCFKRVVSDAGGGNFRTEIRPGMTFEKMFRFWNGGIGGLQDPPLPMVAAYASSQMKNFEEAKGILAANGA